jgi:hypothetical protein
MGVEPPEAVASKSESFPEFRMGVQRVRVILRAGAVVDDVMVCAGRLWSRCAVTKVSRSMLTMWST